MRQESPGVCRIFGDPGLTRIDMCPVSLGVAASEFKIPESNVFLGRADAVVTINKGF